MLPVEQFEHFEILCPEPLKVPGIHAVDSCTELKKLPTGELLVKVWPVRDKTRDCFRFLRFRRQVVTTEDDGPRVRLHKSGKHANRCGLSRPVRPEKPHDFSGWDVQIYSVHGQSLAEPLCQVFNTNHLLSNHLAAYLPH